MSAPSLRARFPRRMRPWPGVVAASVCLLAVSGSARADMVYTINTTNSPTIPVNTSNPTSDGTVYATATFSTFTGLQIGGQTYSGIKVVLDNLLDYNGNGGEGRAISGIKFQFGSTTLGTALKNGSPTLVEDQGQEIKTSTNTVLPTVTGSGANLEHWGSGTDSNSYFHVETVGNFASGGQPNHLIDPALTSGSGYNSSFNQHDNGFDTEATFYIAFNTGVVTGSTTLTSSDIANVQIQFGTTSGKYGATQLTSTVVPAPPSALLLGIGVGMLGMLRVFRRPAVAAKAAA
jgi:hypothetical protein